MLRIHFTGRDLGRIRIAARPDALWETVLSFHRLRDKRSAAVFGEWRRETRTRLNGEARLLAPLVPMRGYFPDFLTPPEGICGMEPAMEALRETPPERLRRDLGLLAAGARDRRPSGPAPRHEELATGRPRALDELIGALRGYHRAAIAPYWPHIRAQIEADRAARGRALLDGGADRLLASLPPAMRWRPPVLEADYPVDRDLRLNGRGLLLLPSFFCRVTPVAFHDPELAPVLVYPVRHAGENAAPAPLRPYAADVGSLGRLVGQTRSAVLRTIEGGCTTGELARRVGVSAASASQHASVLRDAGLVVTLRHGSAVLHTLTPLGAALLHGGADVSPAADGAGRAEVSAGPAPGARAAATSGTGR
ncbi:helix-turn-helix domain-containing protein [Streptomyces sp. F63]|uniref:helix-turn-helix domain-containing protein n=1 Tax=Streptomyces sp. F63 TaxID=2824887 RepID=UPI001B36C5DD|nr:helix-turn-helix domain-containing protein [Streptomyces sp. F63]MBQ0987739.1 helix-turn-helix domain-containing protein [Streptomyces sp. F63]